MNEKKPVLTLLRSGASFDFSNIIGHKDEINKAITAKLKQNELRVEKGRRKFIDDRKLIMNNITNNNTAIAENGIDATINPKTLKKIYNRNVGGNSDKKN